MATRQVLTLKIEVRALAGESHRLAIRTFFLGALLAVTSACAPRSELKDTSDQLNLRTGIEHTGYLNKDVSKLSESYYRYLIGELSYLDQDISGAQSELEKASAIIQDPAPLLHQRLAEFYVRSGDLAKAEAEAKLGYEQEDPEKNVSSLLWYAGILTVAGKDAEATDLYSKAVVKAKDRVDPYLLGSSLLLKNGKLNESKALLKQLVLVKPKEPLVYLFLGRTEELLGHFKDAESNFKKAEDLSGGKSVAFVDLIRVLLAQKRYNDAKKYCIEKAGKDPGDPINARLLQLFEMPKAFQESASGELQELEKRSDTPAGTRFRIALYLIEKQEFRDAVRELTLVLAGEPQNYEARYYLASIYAGSGRRKEAVAELWKIPKESSLFVKSRTFGAFILRQDSILKDAKKAVEEALEVEPTNQSLTLYLVLLLREEEEFTEARRVLEKALMTYPKDEKLLFNLALVFHDLKRDDKSLATMEQVLEINPMNVDALNYVAYALSDKAVELNRAETLIRKALDQRPNDGFFLDTLGWIYLKQARIKDAEDTLSRAVAATGDDIVIVEHYVEALVQSGKKESAVGIMKGMIEKNGDEEELPHEKKAALSRMQSKLNQLLSDHPELRAVKEKKLPEQQSSVLLFDALKA